LAVPKLVRRLACDFVVRLPAITIKSIQKDRRDILVLVVLCSSAVMTDVCPLPLRTPRPYRRRQLFVQVEEGKYTVSWHNCTVIGLSIVEIKIKNAPCTSDEQ
jgi:hypothetical protein